MGIEVLAGMIHEPGVHEWDARNEKAFEALFGAAGGRYSEKASKAVTLRAPMMSGDGGISYAAYIHPNNPRSGQYTGMSFCVFPIPDGPALISMIVGTGGLGADQAILGRPGHARKIQAICEWLNAKFGNGQRVAWSKEDPTRTDIPIPEEVSRGFEKYNDVFKRYGSVIYALYVPNSGGVGTTEAIAAFLDLMFRERGYETLKDSNAASKAIRNDWFSHLMPDVGREEVVSLLKQRKYVVVEGPPGTGKTRLADEVRRKDYGGRGRTIQFHPNTTYENFVGGLAPAAGSGETGLRFRPQMGALMEVAREAIANPGETYLLHIDEINRADLGKVLGEAIYLLEPREAGQREVALAYDFGEPFGTKFWLPENLHILGTMNSSDRSIAMIDIAVRRRFGFVSLWPKMSVVQEHGSELMVDAFEKIQSIFVEHASGEAFRLVPGHSYFLTKDAGEARQALRTGLQPLLEEYLAQGYVTGFGESIRSYLQWLRAQ